MSMHLSPEAARVHAFLFLEGGSLARKRLADLAQLSPEQLKSAVSELAAALQGSGLTLVISDHEIALATAPDVAASIKQIFEAQLQRDIGEAGLEVLAIVLYRGPSTRAEIDYIRGVNTSSSVRALLSRGLVEKREGQGREYRYGATAELLAHLGVTRVEDLPEYATIRGELAAFEQSRSPFTSYAGDESEAGTTSNAS